MYLIYLAMGLLFALIYIRTAYRWPATYLALLLGAIVAPLLIVTQTPLQKMLVQQVIIPQVSRGGSPYFWSFLPALVAALLQEGLKMGSIWAVAKRFRPKLHHHYVTIGAACGGGFGIVAGCYVITLTGVQNFLSWHLLEHGVYILFHATSGAMLGYALSFGPNSRRWLQMLLGMIAFNCALRYLPIFVQQRSIPVEVMHFLLAILVTGLVFAAMMMFGRANPSRSR